MSDRFYADLHSHTTLFPYNMGKENTQGMMYSRDPLIKEDLAPNYTQADLSKLARGNVRVVFAALYPVETGFMRLIGKEGDVADDFISVFTGFPKDRINEVQAPGHNYFDDMKRELALLKQYEMAVMQVKDANMKCQYKIVSNFADLKDFLGMNDDFTLKNNSSDIAKIALVLTIEGGHSFLPKPAEEIACNVNDLNDPATRQLLDTIKQNIAYMKEQKLFHVTFAHHFYNLYCGMSISFTRLMDGFFDQGNYSTMGFTELGKEVIKEMVRQNIIIDVKHLSVPSRQWLYEQDFMRNKPVVASHSAVNGAKTMADSMADNNTHKKAQEKYNKSNQFNTWDLNLSDQEIEIIARRGGLIGLSIDQRIIMGKKKLQCIKISALVPFGKKKTELWCQPVYDNIMYIARTLKDKGIDEDKIWDTVTLGTDYDGLINPVNSYRTTLEFPTLEDTLTAIFKKNMKKEPLLKNKSEAEIVEIVKKFCYKNSLAFLDTYFK